MMQAVITIQEGDEIAFPPRQIKIFLFEDDEDVAGKTYRYARDKDFGGPHVYMTYEQPDNDIGETETFLKGYACIISFGKRESGRIPVKLYLCLPDSAKSVVAGQFEVKAGDQ